MRAERRTAADAQGAEARDRPRVHRQREARQVRLMVDLDVLIADLGLGEALLTERPGQRRRPPTGPRLRQYSGSGLVRWRRWPAPAFAPVAAPPRVPRAAALSLSH